MKQLVEVIKLVADKYLDKIELILAENTLTLQYFIYTNNEKDIYKTIQISEFQDKLNVMIRPDMCAKLTNIAGLEDIILILDKQSTWNEHTQEEIRDIKAKFTKDLKVKLIKMYDLYSAPPTGTIGVVDYVDDMGQVHINWENGSTLPLAVEIDDFEVMELQDE